MEEERSYRVYVTDSLYAQRTGGGLSSRWAEIMEFIPVDDRTGDDIALEVIKNAGLKFGGEED